MGAVFYDLVYREAVTWFVIVWCLITLMMLHRRFLAKRFERLEELVLGPRRRHQVTERTSENDYKVTTFVTCANVEPEVFEEAMRRIRAQKGLSEHHILVMMDQVDDPDNPEGLAIQNLATAEKYADFTFVTNVRDKRTNLSNLIRFAREKNVLHERLALMDDDTLCDHEWVLGYLAYEFDDPEVGGATTSQRALRTETPAERIGDWLENARLKSSMAAGSLYGQIGCLPGRLYMVRTELVADRIEHELATEVWRGNFKPRRPTLRNPWPFEKWEIKTAPGDDRRVTEFVIEAGGKTVLVLPAGVKTLIPDTWPKTWSTWKRWSTSSQGYFFKSFFGKDWRKWWPKLSEFRPWRLKGWWKQWFIFYHYAGDILLTHATVALTLLLLLSPILNNGELLLPLAVVWMLSFVGIHATFGFRQFAHLKENPRDVFKLTRFIYVVTKAQFDRFGRCYARYMIGTWGTRAGVDEDVPDPYAQEYKPGS